MSNELAQKVATRFLQNLYKKLVPDASITLTDFTAKLNEQMADDPVSRELVSRGISDAYYEEVDKYKGDKNAVFGGMFHHLKPPRMVSKGVVQGTGGGVCSVFPSSGFPNAHLHRPPQENR